MLEGLAFDSKSKASPSRFRFINHRNKKRRYYKIMLLKLNNEAMPRLKYAKYNFAYSSKSIGILKFKVLF